MNRIPTGRISRIALSLLLALAFTLALLVILGQARPSVTLAAPPATAAQPNTYTVLSSAPNPSAYGQPVTFTALVTSTLGTPAGVVTFTVDAATAVTSTLAGGQATYATAFLARGTHEIMAAYGGDGPFQPSASAALVQTVGSFHAYLPLVSRPCLPLRSDDFSDPASGWPVWGGTVSAGGYLDGEYRILVRRGGYLSLSTPGANAGNFHVWVDGRAAGHLAGAYGVIFAYTPAGFYTFEVFDGQLAVLRFDNPGGWSLLAGPIAHPAILTGNATNRLEVERVGDRILLSANGKPIGPFHDSKYMTGSVGVVAEAWEDNFDARFDNFLLYDDSCSPGPRLPGALNGTGNAAGSTHAELAAPPLEGTEAQ